MPASAFPPDLDRASMRLAEPARGALLADERRIVIVGARGWIGRTALALLREALSPIDFATRVVCFGSASGEVELETGGTVPQRALATLGELPPRPTLLLHLAFLTKDKAAGMDADAYTQANRTLSGQVLDALGGIGADRVFVASSGAAAFANDPEAAADLRLYGQLKAEDEERFAAWAHEAEGRRVAIGRIYSVSGPFINKLDTYALASFILDALAGRAIEVRAPMSVLRSYVPVRELLSFVFATLLRPGGAAEQRFDTGGEAMELAQVAQIVAELFGVPVHRKPIVDGRENRYVGDHARWCSLLAELGMAPAPLPGQIAETAAYLARAGTV